ncbi:hypothetical protein [Streptomyces sp. NPDC056160]|uniref:hypothetical protein n=1 Tax=Streptomyces sp. NPDC056160 TaxID=3345731 RepID=UPI0035E3B636
MLVAVLLLPLMGGLLLVMDRIEDRMSGAATRDRPTRHRRHLRLIPGGRRDGAREPGPAAEPAGQEEAA